MQRCPFVQQMPHSLLKTDSDKSRLLQIHVRTNERLKEVCPVGLLYWTTDNVQQVSITVAISRTQVTLCTVDATCSPPTLTCARLTTQQNIQQPVVFVSVFDSFNCHSLLCCHTSHGTSYLTINNVYKEQCVLRLARLLVSEISESAEPILTGGCFLEDGTSI